MADFNPSTYPEDGLAIANIPIWFRYLQQILEDTFNKEHANIAGNYAVGDDSFTGGEHREGSAKVFCRSAAPAYRPEAGDEDVALTTADAGRLWIDTDDGHLYYWSGAAWVDMMSAFEATEGNLNVIGDLTVNTDKFTVDADNGNTVIDGSLSIASFLASGGFIDDDSFATASATSAASSESIKAYADTKEAAIITQAATNILGSRTDVDSTDTTLAKDTTYRAQSDGFLFIRGQAASTGNGTMGVYAGGVKSNVGGLLEGVLRDTMGVGYCITGAYGALHSIIKKNEYLRIHDTGVLAVDVIRWMPFGTGKLVKQ